MPEDLHQLERFLVAQEGIYEQALAELRREKKRTHWIWYVFPQLDGLGSSPTARFYAIKSIAEAKAYLLHPVLGPRLIECAEALLAIQGKTVPIHFSVSAFQFSAFQLLPPPPLLSRLQTGLSLLPHHRPILPRQSRPKDPRSARTA